MLPVLAGPGGGEVWVQGGGLLAPRVAALQRRHEQRAEGRAELAAVIMIRSGMIWMALMATVRVIIVVDHYALAQSVPKCQISRFQPTPKMIAPCSCAQTTRLHKQHSTASTAQPD